MIQGGMVKRAIGAEDITRAFPPSRSFLQGPYSTRSRGVLSFSFLPFRKRGEQGGMKGGGGAGQNLSPSLLGGSEAGTGRNGGRVMAARAAPKRPRARPPVQVVVSFIRGSGAAADESTPDGVQMGLPRTFRGTSYGGKRMTITSSRPIHPGFAPPGARSEPQDPVLTLRANKWVIVAPRVPTGAQTQKG